MFYDLVYVVVIARTAHTLAENVSWTTVGEFAVIFGLIWIAWWNETLYYELHGREDGRTRTFVFVQMLLLALLAVFAADASGEGRRWFALLYTAFLMVVTWLWYTVRRQDSEEYNTATSRFLRGMIASIAVIAGSAFLPEQARIWVWAGFIVAWMGGALVLAHMSASALDIGVASTDSIAERFSLFIIIVLGEVVVGAVVRNLKLGAQRLSHRYRHDRTDDRIRFLVDLLRFRRSAAA